MIKPEVSLSGTIQENKLKPLITADLGGGGVMSSNFFSLEETTCFTNGLKQLQTKFDSILVKEQLWIIFAKNGQMSNFTWENMIPSL